MLPFGSAAVSVMHGKDGKMEKKRAFIYTGGTLYANHISEKPQKEDLVIAADVGVLNALNMGAHPDVMVGDFDTLDASELPKETETIRLPAEKDMTDTQFAVNLALERGASELVIVGSLEGRVDHTVSLLAIPELMWERKEGRVPTILTNGKNRVRFLRNSGVILMREQYRYFSILAVDEKVKGVTLEGCKYPLKNATLFRSHQWAVSNEIEGNCALIEVRRGGVLVVESMD